MSPSGFLIGQLATTNPSARCNSSADCWVLSSGVVHVLGRPAVGLEPWWKCLARGCSVSVLLMNSTVPDRQVPSIRHTWPGTVSPPTTTSSTTTGPAGHPLTGTECGPAPG